MSDQPKIPVGKEHIITPQPAQATIAVSIPTLWTWWSHSTVAPEWFADAIKEDRPDDHNAHRREILFSVCAVESYLLEWVRDKVLKGQWEKLDKYFPNDDRRGIKLRWKEVLKKLEEHGESRGSPDFSTKTWKEFCKLVDYRDALVHAGASRPIIAGQQGNKSRNMRKFNQMREGWAVGIIVRLIRELHTAVGTSPPPWLEDPRP